MTIEKDEKTNAMRILQLMKISGGTVGDECKGIIADGCVEG